MFALSTH